MTQDMPHGPTEIAFALPGRITNLTGGTIYDRRVIEALPDLGIRVWLIELPGSFPAPPPSDMHRALAQLTEVPREMPLIVDGLAFGALEPEAVARIAARLFALVHHPLAEESGLPEHDRQRLLRSETETLKAARHVLVPSPHTAELLCTKYDVSKGRITVARPGTDRPAQGAPATPPTTPPATPPLILAVGIQAPRKGHDVLLHALSRIAGLDWRAVIVGAPLDPRFAAELSALAQRLGLQDRVTLAGEVSQEALEAYYARASVFALATRYEGYGIVFDEALMHGLPIVTCATGAVPQTVPQGAGLLTPPDAPGAFAHALRRMLTEPGLRASCAAAARQASHTLPSWADTAQIFADVLRHHYPRDPAT